MTETLEARAEVAKLARLLGVEVAEIAYMEKVGAEGLAEFRAQLVDSFYGDSDSGLQRFASVGNLLPAKVIAMLTREAVGPVLAARIAGLVDPKQAVAIVAKLPIKFVTDIAVEIDPRRIEPVLGAMPRTTIAAISGELIKRKEYVTMGQFIAFLDQDTLAGTFAKMSDADLLQIAFVTEDKDRLYLAVEMLSDARVKRTMLLAGRDGMWAEALDLLRHMDDSQYFRLIDIASKLDAKTQDELVKVTRDDDLWSIMLPALAQMADPSAPVDALLRADGATIKAFADAIASEEAWEDARELFEKLGEDQMTELRQRFAKNGRLAILEPVADLLPA